jgi:hypothetical protein
MGRLSPLLVVNRQIALGRALVPHPYFARPPQLPNPVSRGASIFRVLASILSAALRHETRRIAD